MPGEYAGSHGGNAAARHWHRRYGGMPGRMPIDTAPYGASMPIEPVLIPDVAATGKSARSQGLTGSQAHRPTGTADCPTQVTPLTRPWW